MQYKSTNTSMMMSVLLAFALCVLPAQAQERSVCPVARPNAVVLYGGIDSPLVLTARELAELPSTSVQGEPHGGTMSTYTGPALHELLKKANMPSGVQLRGGEMSRYVVVEAADGYRALFALAELDPAFRRNVPILALRQNNAPLDSTAGPYQVVVAEEMRHARWVRQVVCIRLARDSG